jgi:hypothetical protein
MLQKIGEACPIFPVSAKQAWDAKQTEDPTARATLWCESGFDALEEYIAGSVTSGITRTEKFASVCRSAQVILADFSRQVSSSAEVVSGDLAKLRELRGVLEERKDQSFRQIGGVLWGISQASERTQRRGEELLREKLTFGSTLKLMFGRGKWENFFQNELEGRQREMLTKLVRESLELIESDLKSMWKQVHELMQRSFTSREAPTLPDFARQRKELLDRIDLALIERTEGAEFQRQMQRVFADTASWLRVPAGVFAAGGIGAAVAAALTKATILDITGTVAGLGALTGTIIAVAKRRKILRAYAREMNDKREAMMQAIDEHLRHAVKRFYAELEQVFQPIEAFAEAQKKTLEPSLGAVHGLEIQLGRCAASLNASGAPAATG